MEEWCVDEALERGKHLIKGEIKFVKVKTEKFQSEIKEIGSQFAQTMSNVDEIEIQLDEFER